MEQKKISVEYMRDPVGRLTEVVVINRDHEGHEVHGVIINCHDSGKITIGANQSWPVPKDA